MRQLLAKPGGGIGSLRVGNAPIPTPGPGEALVRLVAASLNYRDLLCLRGLVPSIKEPEYVPLSDAVGYVEAVGEGVNRVAPGMRVTPLFSQGWIDGSHPSMSMLGGPVDGVAREFAVFEAQNLCIVPDEIGDLEATTLPCAGLTAWSAVFGPRPIQPGEWVLVQGTGGVSLAAMQWAKAGGANVVVTSSCDAKLARARFLGADLEINYRRYPHWAGEARRRLDSKGVDIVVDVVGMSQIDQCLELLNPGGVVAAIGRLEGETTQDIASDGSIARIVVGNRCQHEAMLAFAARQNVRPVVDRVFDFERAAQAFQTLESGNFLGKIVLNLA
ncbi:zinc-dependent alcohol dehydrogenase family protein [Novosphingobium sp.]|uniref:zinc-dependent alcohol dehydrogenase family protein n=1 Tax=Novosphingobium sp. TaxID=1874826 RepID=UPI002FDF85D5